ncbi:MAG: hypothetical protein AMXMBFR64_36700 [Myxococcales bacterium]
MKPLSFTEARGRKKAATPTMPARRTMNFEILDMVRLHEVAVMPSRTGGRAIYFIWAPCVAQVRALRKLLFLAFTPW